MIDEIRVENLALIREASLVPCTGLTVLTGETGAGKTALLSALKLLMGERADASSVREDEAGLVVEGRFSRAWMIPRDSVLSVAYLPMVVAVSKLMVPSRASASSRRALAP